MTACATAPLPHLIAAVDGVLNRRRHATAPVARRLPACSRASHACVEINQ